MRSSDRILVVGGAGGIGAAIAAEYAPRAVIWSRRHGVDAGDEASVTRAAEALLADGGAPYAIVHSVGDFDERPLLHSDFAFWRWMLDSNLTSAFLTARALVPAMVAAQRGRVLFFSAAGADDGTAKTRAPVYFAAKAALCSLARSLAREVASSGVTVNVLSPGIIRHQDSHAASQDRIGPTVPLGREGTPRDLLGAVRLLLGEEGAYITGANLTIDGGLSA